MPKKRCTKTKNFPTKDSARQAIYSFRSGAMYVPCRIYWCSRHKAYHLTGQPRH